MVASHVQNRTERLESPPADRIGEYTVLRKIGAGGMATVWQVEGPGGKLHALKEMKQNDDAKRETTKRFKQEFKITGKLDHRNIVRVTDFFSAQKTLHIVMEWVDGLDLRGVLRHAGMLDPGRLSLVGAEVASGLASAHAQGILHRDLKPENILMSKRGEVKVTDFGVARLIGTRLTATGIIVGSPAYMSPEQLAGVSGQKLGSTTDIYALGVMLYELAEGREPLGLKRGDDLLTVLKAKRDKSPRRMRHLQHDDLEELILHCLETEAEDRPEDMDGVARRLRRIARALGAKRSDLKFLAKVALDNKDKGRKVRGEQAPKASEDGNAREAGPAARVRRDARRAGVGSRRQQEEALTAVAPNATPTEAKRRSLEQIGSGGRRREGLGAVEPSQVTELSVKRRAALLNGGGLVSWLAIGLFATAVVFLSVSMSLTGSPLGLLDILVPLPR